MARRESKRDSQPVHKVTEDKRFAHVQEDPRFFRPKKSHTKVKVDKRFSHMIKDADFTETTKVDRYGRVQEDNRTKQYLKNTYEFSSDSEASTTSDNESESSDDEAETKVDIDRARGRGGDLEESSDSDDSDISDVEWGKFGGGPTGSLSDVEEDPEDIPRGDETRRFACVNMDWDHVRATDLFAVFAGFKPDSGAVLSVKIYPSEFGAERMAKEAIEGPPREIFVDAKNTQDSEPESSESEEEVDLIKEQVKDNEEFDQIALRKYEMEKMKYYFAVVECDSIETAKAIYDQCDGAEFEASANFFDLRFIPEDMVFEREPKDQAMHLPEKYKPTEFATQALQHSKVQLTWDADEPDRVRSTRRAFTQEEIDDMDFGNLLASSDDSEDSDDESELAQKRALLLSGPAKDSDEESDQMGDMEITFTPGLSKHQESEEETKPRSEETAIERFRRLKKEKREKKKAAKKSSKSGHDSDNLISDTELDPSIANDSFFTYGDDLDEPRPLSKAKDKKGMRESKTQRKQRQEAEAKERAELELLLAGPESDRKHFDLKEIEKAEKQKGRKGKRGKKVQVEDDFELDVSDPRFGALFQSHNFAIDPNNPNFKKTKAMKELLNETRKRHKSS
ncbi:pre-rRNA-processing protein esf1 [Coemansia sp. RSA 989]|nr:pre-rRNA-processing protein ESF1 [Coemansia mojavensis]KAJ1744410.1 pre-rRNA-processing protein esf1 [Coemansia sp. RSA 1086]KAJ1753642.1 pre-rRNA-processing protein esf1 [Coemansia sp. RSA 1821]KAJ1868538.1 pre-rRNA-processing protein esf1 [Coemansia sp. RSA 989]KAJ2675868.1 pre-rRNA-processing protein esf1 [Coemansia sp. RSA 1085]